MTAGSDTCPKTGKLRYATRTGAYLKAAVIQKRRPANGIKAAPCQVYRCEWCHAFHIGHADWRKARK